MADERTITGRNIEFQRREWRVQRIGWLAMLLVVVSAFFGLLGSGPLAETSVSSGNGALSVDYHRIARHHQPRTLTVTVAPEAVQNSQVQIWLDQAYVSRFGLQNIVPEPESTDIEPDRVIYTFTTGEANSPLTITFYYEHDSFWRQKGQVGIVDGPSVGLTQFVLP